jgi:hypothetical protein
VAASLARLPRGDYKWKAPPPLPGKKALAIRDVSLPTNYILGYYAGPPAGTDDYNALRLATAILSGRFFTEIRSKRSLSYAADAPFVERAMATGGVYVTTVDPNTTLTIMRAEMNRLQTQLIDDDALDQLVEQFITEYFLKNETNSDQASFLARAEIYQGDYRAADQALALATTARAGVGQVDVAGVDLPGLLLRTRLLGHPEVGIGLGLLGRARVGAARRLGRLGRRGVADRDDRRTDGNGLALGHHQLRNDAGERRRQLDQRLGGLDLDQDLVDRDGVTLLDLPGHDLGLGETLTHVGQLELGHGGSFQKCGQKSSVRSTASSTRSRSGSHSSSIRAGGYGVSNPPTRSTGASRE